MRDILIIILAVAAFFVVAWWLLFPPKASGNAQPAFDHSNCQYPTRWSNPPDGCDNSDPAVPECVGKGQTEAEEKRCIDAFVKQNNDIEPISEPKTAPAASQKQTTPKCTE